VKRLVEGLALATAIFAAAGASAHPHVWITVQCAFQFDEARRVTGFVETWTFDEMYSALAVTVRRDQRARAGALTPLAASIVADSKADEQFTTAAIGRQPVAFGEPADIGGEWKDGRLQVRFRLSFREPQSLGDRTLRIEVRDPDLYADFQFDPKPDSAGLPHGCKVRLMKPEETLPLDPQARMNALISGPLVDLTSGLGLRCGE
jgi:ABC-type uncharacterized transport system substrate-binding protein